MKYQTERTTIVVAPVGYANKADYYTDGVADDVQIQAALDTMHALGGGVLELKAGTYNILSQIVVYSNICIRGEGIGGKNGRRYRT